jgi:hypothetical protein
MSVDVVAVAIDVDLSCGREDVEHVGGIQLANDSGAFAPRRVIAIGVDEMEPGLARAGRATNGAMTDQSKAVRGAPAFRNALTCGARLITPALRGLSARSRALMQDGVTRRPRWAIRVHSTTRAGAFPFRGAGNDGALRRRADARKTTADGVLNGLTPAGATVRLTITAVFVAVVRARPRRIDEAFIGETVAVVIPPVTDFNRRCRRVAQIKRAVGVATLKADARGPAIDDETTPRQSSAISRALTRIGIRHAQLSTVDVLARVEPRAAILLTDSSAAAGIRRAFVA